MGSKLDIITRSVSKSLFKVKKHSPEILLVAGIVGVVGGCIMACKATTKVGEVLEETKESVDEIKTKAEENDISEEDRKKALAVTYVRAILNFAKLYGPAVAVELMSIVSLLASHNILHKRNAALAAAYAMVDKGFKEYRNRVFDKFGEEIERELYHDTEDRVEEQKTTLEDGSEKVEKVVKKVAKSAPSGYARVFGKYTEDDMGNKVRNTVWDPIGCYNYDTLVRVQTHVNDLLRIRGWLCLNDVYKELGLGRTKAGQVIGWVWDPSNKNLQNHIDFGIDRLKKQGVFDYYSDSVEGPYDDVIIDFNPDGNILEML